MLEGGAQFCKYCPLVLAVGAVVDDNQLFHM